MLPFDTTSALFVRHECFSIMKHSSSIDAKILANINKGEVDEFSTQAGGGFLGKIFDMSNKQRAADRVSRATLGEKIACAAICVFKLQSAFLVLLPIERNPGKFPANFLVIGDSPLLKPQKQCTIGLKERQDDLIRSMARNTYSR